MKRPEPKSKLPWTQSFYWFAAGLAALVAAVLAIYPLIYPKPPALTDNPSVPAAPSPQPDPNSPRQGSSPRGTPQAAPEAYRGAPVIRLSPASGLVGTTVTVRGENFGSNEWVRIDFPKVNSQDWRADHNGSFSGVTFHVPNLPPGEHPFKAVGLSSGRRPDPAPFVVRAKSSSK